MFCIEPIRIAEAVHEKLLDGSEPVGALAGWLCNCRLGRSCGAGLGLFEKVTVWW
jgi:hypothetical protein